MERISLRTPIFWTMALLWWTYRYFSNLPRILEQAKWIAAGDTIALIGCAAVAVYYWVQYAKNRKNR